MSRQLSVSANLTPNKKLQDVLSEKQNTPTQADSTISPKKNVTVASSEEATSTEIKLPAK
jgi:hypothetical protein